MSLGKWVADLGKWVAGYELSMRIVDLCLIDRDRSGILLVLLTCARILRSTIYGRLKLDNVEMSKIY